MAIAFVVSNDARVNNGTAVAIAFPGGVAAGNTIVVTTEIGTTTSTVSKITDPAGNTYTFRAAINNGTLQRAEVWSTAAGASLALAPAASVTVTLTAASAFVGDASVYSGVLGLGVTGTNTGTSAAATLTITTQDNNNWIVVGHAVNVNVAPTANVGTLRRSRITNTNAGALVDNTVAAPGALTCSTTNSLVAWATAGLELRTVAAGGTSTFGSATPDPGRHVPLLSRFP